MGPMGLPGLNGTDGLPGNDVSHTINLPLHCMSGLPIS